MVSFKNFLVLISINHNTDYIAFIQDQGTLFIAFLLATTYNHTEGKKCKVNRGPNKMLLCVTVMLPNR